MTRLVIIINKVIIMIIEGNTVEAAQSIKDRRSLSASQTPSPLLSRQSLSSQQLQKETLKLEAESEYRRREEAVLATKRVMAERARAVSE